MSFRTKTKIILPIIAFMGLAACGTKTSDSSVESTQPAASESTGESTIVPTTDSTVESIVNSTTVPSISDGPNSTVVSGTDSTTVPSVSTGSSSTTVPGTDSTTIPPISTATPPSTGSSSTTEPPVEVITDWSAADKAVMNTVLGALIPVAPFVEYDCYEEDMGGLCVFVEGYDVLVADAYGDILLANGYSFDEEYFGAMYYSFDVSDAESIIIGVYEEEGDTLIFAYIIDITGGELLTEWPQDLVDLMNEHLGSVIPLAPLTEDLYFAYDDVDKELYIEDIAAGAIITYGATLVSEGFTLDASSSGTDEEWGDYDSDEYSKEIATDTFLCIELIQWLDDDYLSIYAYIVGEGGTVTPPGDGETIKILPTDFLTTSYAANNGEHNITINTGTYKYTTTDLMKENVGSNSDIQMKKNTGVIKNTAAWPAIASIKLVFGENNLTSSSSTSDDVIVSAGSSTGSLSVIGASSNVYNLGGATFFQIKAGSSALYIREIIITFVE